MPGHDGVRAHDDQGVDPARPQTAEDYPKGSVKCASEPPVFRATSFYVRQELRTRWGFLQTPLSKPARQKYGFIAPFMPGRLRSGVIVMRRRLRGCGRCAAEFPGGGRVP